MVLVGERADRGGMPQEHLRALACRPAVPDVVDDRPADVLEQRQLHPPAGLGLHHREPVAGPVEVGEPQPFDVDAAQPEPGDQQDDRVIAFAARVSPVDRLQEPSLTSAGSHTDGILACLLDFAAGTASNTVAVDQPVAGGEPQERPHGAQLLLHRLGLVAGQRGHERVDHPRVQASQSAPRADEREELPGHRAIGPDRRHGAASRLQRRLEPSQNVGLLGVQLVHASGVAAQHRPVDGEVVEHRRDPEQVHVGRLQRAGLLLVEEAARRLVDPRHRDIQRELLHATGREEPLQAAPAAPVPDHRRGLVAQPHQLGVQPGHQFGNSSHDGRPPITKARHHAEPRDQSPSAIMRSVRSSPPPPPAATGSTLRITQRCS